MVLDSIIVFSVSLAIGALGIHLGAVLVTGKSDYRDAILTALLGSLVWALTGFFFGFIPLLGPAVVLLAWFAVIKARYRGGWIDAALIGLIAWISVLVILYLLAGLNVTTFGAVGVPSI